MIQCRRSLRLNFSSTSAYPIKTRTNVCHGITAHTLWRFHGEHQVNTESFQVHIFTCRNTLSCTRATKEASWFWGCGQFLPFVIKRILGIKCIFPCSFGNKRMRLLTRVYGMCIKLKSDKQNTSIHQEHNHQNYSHTACNNFTSEM